MCAISERDESDKCQINKTQKYIFRYQKREISYVKRLTLIRKSHIHMVKLLVQLPIQY